MKKILFWSLLALVSAGTVAAKKNGKPVPASGITDVFPAAKLPVDVADLQELLELKGMYVHKYDLSGIKDTTLQVIFQVDEYFGRDSVRTVRRLVMGNLYSQWDSTFSQNLKFMIVPHSDSTAMLYCDLEGRMKAAALLKFRRAEPDFKRYNTYRPKSFKTEGLGVDGEVPVMLFGAFWYDAELSKRFGGEPAYRFCMEREMDADMHNEAFGRMPHYWIVYIGLQKKGK